MTSMSMAYLQETSQAPHIWQLYITSMNFSENPILFSNKATPLTMRPPPEYVWKLYREMLGQTLTGWYPVTFSKGMNLQAEQRRQVSISSLTSSSAISGPPCWLVVSL